MSLCFSSSKKQLLRARLHLPAHSSAAAVPGKTANLVEAQSVLVRPLEDQRPRELVDPGGTIVHGDSPDPAVPTKPARHRSAKIRNTTCHELHAGDMQKTNKNLASGLPNTVPSVAVRQTFQFTNAAHEGSAKKCV